MTKEKDKLRDNELKSFLDKYLNNSDIELLAIRTKAENFVKFEGEYGKILLALGVSDDRIVDYVRVYETPYVKFNKKIFKDIRTVLIEFDPHRYSRYDIFMSHFIKSNLWTKEDADEKENTSGRSLMIFLIILQLVSDIILRVMKTSFYMNFHYR